MMSCRLLFLLATVTWFQANPSLPAIATADCITAAEKLKLSTQERIDSRIKTYRDISERLHSSVESAIANKSFDEVPALLTCWKEHLAASGKDIEAKVNRKNKSGALINYEIQIRKSILDMHDAQLKVPLQQQSEFESWLSQAEVIRKRFVDILFQR